MKNHIKINVKGEKLYKKEKQICNNMKLENVS